VKPQAVIDAVGLRTLMKDGGRAATTSLSSWRASLGWRNCISPLSFTPCSANTFLARSSPTATIAMDFPF
jgi:hypothetical protein